MKEASYVLVDRNNVKDICERAIREINLLRQAKDKSFIKAETKQFNNWFRRFFNTTLDVNQIKERLDKGIFIDSWDQLYYPSTVGKTDKMNAENILFAITQSHNNTVWISSHTIYTLNSWACGRRGK